MESSSVFDLEGFQEWLETFALNDVVGATGWNVQSVIISYVLGVHEFEEYAILPGGIVYVAGGTQYTEEFPRWVDLFLKKTTAKMKLTNTIVVYPFLTARECKKQLAAVLKGMEDASNNQKSDQEKTPTTA